MKDGENEKRGLWEREVWHWKVHSSVVGIRGLSSERKNGLVICLDDRRWASQRDKVNKGKASDGWRKRQKDTEKKWIEMGRRDQSFWRDINQIRAELHQISRCQKRSKFRLWWSLADLLWDPLFQALSLLYSESQHMSRLNYISHYALPVGFCLGSGNRKYRWGLEGRMKGKASCHYEGTVIHHVQHFEWLGRLPVLTEFRKRDCSWVQLLFISRPEKIRKQVICLWHTWNSMVRPMQDNSYRHSSSKRRKGR